MAMNSCGTGGALPPAPEYRRDRRPPLCREGAAEPQFCVFQRRDRAGAARTAGASPARPRLSRRRPRRRASLGGLARGACLREPGRRGGQRLHAGARRAPGRSRRGVLDPLDQPGGCPARGGFSLCAGPYPARPRSRPHGRGRRAHAERGLVGLRGGAFVPCRGSGDLRAETGLAGSFRHSPLRVARPRGGRHRLSPASWEPCGAERGGASLPDCCAARRRHRPLSRRDRPHGLASGAGKEPRRADGSLRAGVECL